MGRTGTGPEGSSGNRHLLSWRLPARRPATHLRLGLKITAGSTFQDSTMANGFAPVWAADRQDEVLMERPFLIRADDERPLFT